MAKKQKEFTLHFRLDMPEKKARAVSLAVKKAMMAEGLSKREIDDVLLEKVPEEIPQYISNGYDRVNNVLDDLSDSCLEYGGETFQEAAKDARGMWRLHSILDGKLGQLEAAIDAFERSIHRWRNSREEREM